MTSPEKQRFDMLVRVLNFGETNRQLFASAPAARETLAAIRAAVDDIATEATKKTTTAANSRSDRRVATRKELRVMLAKACRLARTLREDKRPAPDLEMPPSRRDMDLQTNAEVIAREVAPFDADFSAHGLSSQRIRAALASFAAAVRDQDHNRLAFVGVRVRLSERIRAAIRAARRLDLIIEDLTRESAVLAEWKQLRRINPPGSRRGARAQGSGGVAAN
jgi:hypothetical protein